MTINSTTRKAGPFTGNGSATVFPFTFKVFTAADIEAVRLNVSTQVETVLALGTDYTVTLNADQDSNPGGSITLPSVLATGYNLVITSDIGNLQPTDLTNQGGFYPDVINDSLDRATIQIQQLQEAVDRSAKLPITSAADADALVADIIRLADSADNLDLDANNINAINTVATNISNVNTVAGNNTNITTVAGISANVTSVAGNSSNINSVAGNATNINAVAGNAANINAVNSNSSNINTVATNSTSVSTVATNIAAVNSAYTNIAAIIDAPTQAANAATSAAQAAASAASGMYSGVQDKSANYTIVAADAGDLIRVTTTSGAVTITLPLIGSTSIIDGFKIAVVKWTSDANPVNIARSGSDTINGATSAQIGSQYSQIIFVADAETNTWFASQSGLGATNVNVDVFNGNGSTTAFTLAGDPGTKNNTDIYIGGVHQDHSTYSISGTTLTFSTAPPSGSSNIEVVYGTPLAIGSPSDGTVTAAKIAAGAVELTTKVSGTLPVNNGGTGASTLAANNVLLGNGTSALQAVAPGTSGNVLTSNGTTWQSSAPTSTGVNVQTFTSSGTWTKPAYSASSRVLVQCWGGGGSGAKAGSFGCGGGGGGYNERWLSLSQLGATETVTVGAGGASKTTTGAGNAGGNSSVGSLVTGYGGGGGGNDTSGGGGGGQLSAGNAAGLAIPGRPYFCTASDGTNQYYQGRGGTNNVGAGELDALYHGGGGGGNQTGGGAGASSSVWGGGGGGCSQTNTAAGTSSFAGNGGAGAAAGGTAGTAPSGAGGGSTSGNSGAGGAGQVIITVFPA